MALTQVNRGTTPNDNSADTLYVAFGVVNTNFSNLSNVDNTSDVNKPVSTATQNALNLKANLASPTITGTLTTVNDAVINTVKVGKGAGNITDNTVVGNNSLTSNTTGSNNTAIGSSALTNNQGGTSNTAVGSYALLANLSGDGNTSVGTTSLFANSLGGNNTGIGISSLYSNTTGNNNTAIGAGSNLNGNFNNTTCVGYGSEVSTSSQVQLGNSSTTTFVYGTVQNRSDLRDKTEVRNTVLGLDFINELRPVDYKWDMREDYKFEMPIQGELSDEDFKILMDEWLETCKLDNITHDGTHTRTRYHHGLIAQEVQDVIEASGVDFGGFQDHSLSGGQDVLSIGYDELIAPMIKAIQELTARINVLENN